MRGYIKTPGLSELRAPTHSRPLPLPTRTHSHPLSRLKLLAYCKRALSSTLKVPKYRLALSLLFFFFLTPTTPKLHSWEGGTYSEEGRGGAGTTEERGGPAMLFRGAGPLAALGPLKS